MEITSVTQFKRELNIGHKVAITYHLKSKGHSFETNLNEYGDDVRPVRPVVSCNSSHFVLGTLREGVWEGRRVNYPKARNCRIEDGKLVIMGKDLDNPDNAQPIKWLTIEVVN